MIISIGHACVSAELLKGNNARSATYPFDWARSNILSVIDVLKNGHQYHCDNNINNIGKVKHPNKEFGYIEYIHHKYDDKGKQYMMRCSDRLFKKLNGKDKIQFLYMSNIEHAILEDELKLLINTLENKYINLDFEIIMIYYIGNGREIFLKEQGYKYKIYHCKSPKQFRVNNMREDIFYNQLFEFVFKNESKKIGGSYHRYHLIYLCIFFLLFFYILSHIL